MNFPLISEYIEAIKSAEDNFEELSYLRPVFGEDGLPVMTGGNFAEVFKMVDERNGKLYAVKCFTKEQEGRAEAYREIAKELENVSSPYILSIRYLEKELFVDTDQTAENEFPVLLMDWVEGKTLDKYLRENLDDKYALEMLAYRFSQLAQWLIPQPFAHGDLKPDNILVREDGALVLVDYDGMYVPAMKGQKARELGSPDFRHPQRTENDFNENIDDFPIASILLSLSAVSANPNLLEKYGASDRLLFSQSDYICSGNGVINELSEYNDVSLNNLVNVFNYLLVYKVAENRNLFSCKKLEKPSLLQYAEGLSLVSEDEIKNGEFITDYDIYSRNHHRLLRVYDVICYSEYDERAIREYEVLPGTIVICSNAFVNCSLLKKIEIPSSVKIIGAYAFHGCKFKYLKLKDSILFIDKDAFTGSSIEEIVIPDRSLDHFVSIAPYYRDLFVEESKRSEKLSILALQEDIDNGWIDEFGVIYSFDKKRLLKCNVSLSSYRVQSGVLTICNNAFENNLNIEYLTLPESLLEIGESAFLSCKNLKELNFPSNITKIRKRTFLGCESLQIVNLSSTISEIDEEAFSYCKSLKSIVIPPKVNKINRNTFSHCSSLLNVTLHDSIKAIESGAFNRCISLCAISIPKDICFLAYDLFSGCTSLKEIKIPEGIKSIGKYCFNGCRSLVKVDLPNSLEIIDETSFSNCVSLEHITLPNNLKRIGNGAFSGCISLMEIEMPDSISAMGYSCFHRCINLNSIKFPNNIKYISDRVCWECNSLKSVILPMYAEKIGDSSFENCYQLEKIKLPSSLKRIERGAFEHCYKLKDIALPDTIEKIGNECFFCCRSLTTLALPFSLNTIGHNVFAGSGIKMIDCKSPNFESDGKALYSKGKEKLIECYTNDKTFFVPKSVRVIGTWSFNGSSVISVVMKENVEIIEDYAFVGCSSLEDVVLPTSLKEISNDVFSKCISLKQIQIPDGVTKIGYRVFSDCSSLRLVTLPKTLNFIGNYAFYKCDNLQAIIVPSGSISRFESLFENLSFNNYWYKKLLVTQ